MPTSSAQLPTDWGRCLQATEALKITSPELINFGVMDEIIPEPLGGAHSDPMASFPYIKEAILNVYNNQWAPYLPWSCIYMLEMLIAQSDPCCDHAKSHSDPMASFPYIKEAILNVYNNQWAPTLPGSHIQRIHAFTSFVEVMRSRTQTPWRPSPTSRRPS